MPDADPARIRPSGPASAAALTAARLDFRACGRQLARSAGDLSLHLDRLGTALGLPGSEPVQGALADLLVGCSGHAAREQMAAAVQAVRGRLHEHVAQQFEAAAREGGLPRCSRLATRWSVLATMSLDAPRRERRCSRDPSHQAAERGLRAWRDHDAAAIDAFLEHCRVCRDALAFMRVRREILRSGAELPPRWRKLFLLLQATARSP